VVIRFFSSPPQRPMTSDFEGFYIPDCIHYILFLSQQESAKRTLYDHHIWTWFIPVYSVHD